MKANSAPDVSSPHAIVPQIEEQFQGQVQPDMVRQAALATLAHLEFQEPFEQKMRESIIDITQKEDFQDMLLEHLIPKDTTHKLLEKIEFLVLVRLDELTPQTVKEMIEKIIHEHLGWLVVWGGVLGGMIGLISAVIFS